MEKDAPGFIEVNYSLMEPEHTKDNAGVDFGRLPNEYQRENMYWDVYPYHLFLNSISAAGRKY